MIAYWYKPYIRQKGKKTKNISFICQARPKFNPILCISTIKTQICNVTPGCSNYLCPDISLTQMYAQQCQVIPDTNIFISPLLRNDDAEGTGNDGRGDATTF